MNRFLLFLSIAVLAIAPLGCANEPTQEAAATTTAAAPNALAGDSKAGATIGAPKSAEAPAAKPDAPPKPAPPRTYEVPAGTKLTVVLTDSLSTSKNKAGDTFTASLAAPIVVDGVTVADRGATVRGRVIDAEGSGRIKGTANIRLGLTSIVSNNQSYDIVTQPFVAEAEATKGRDAGVIAGGGGVGAAIGAIAGGGKGAAKGAIIGGAAGTAAVLATKGKEVEFGSETKLTFALAKPATLPQLK
jgi:hypothetical protein